MQLPEAQSQSLLHEAPLAADPGWAQHVRVEKEQAPEAQKHPPGTTQSWPPPWLLDGHCVAHWPLLQPW